MTLLLLPACHSWWRGAGARTDTGVRSGTPPPLLWEKEEEEEVDADENPPPLVPPPPTPGPRKEGIGGGAFCSSLMAEGLSADGWWCLITFTPPPGWPPPGWPPLPLPPLLTIPMGPAHRSGGERGCAGTGGDTTENPPPLERLSTDPGRECCCCCC